MTRTLALAAFVVALTIQAPSPARAEPAAQAAPAASPSATRHQADRVIDFLNGKLDAEEIFAPSFLQAIPPAKIGALRDQLVGQLGPAQNYAEWHDVGGNAGYGVLNFARGQMRVELRHGAAPPHLIGELLFKPAAPAADAAGPDALIADFEALPGKKSLAAYRLDGDGPVKLFGTAQNPVLPLGSVFKLWVLAELDAEIRAGTRHWSDVVTLDAKSVPSGMLQGWPTGSPLTLHSVAALMVSISDNSAADLLIDALGRDRIAQRAIDGGWIDAKATLPLLKTAETAAIKSPKAAALAAQWEQGDAATRAALLTAHRGELRAADSDVAALSGNPVHSGTIEWFADADMLARLAGWFAHDAGPETRAILAINPGMVDRDNWAYAGYKGGSEAGVLAAVQLLCRTDKTCFAVTAQWHDQDKPVELTPFSLLVNRAAAQLPRN